MFDITPDDRLLIGNDGQGFQRSLAQARRIRLDQPFDPVGVLRPRPDLKSAGDLSQIKAAAAALILSSQLF